MRKAKVLFPRNGPLGYLAGHLSGAVLGAKLYRYVRVARPPEPCEAAGTWNK